MNAPLWLHVCASACVFVPLFMCIWTRCWSAVIFIVRKKKLRLKLKFVTKITVGYAIISSIVTLTLSHTHIRYEHKTNGKMRWKCCQTTSHVCHSRWILLCFPIHLFSECYVSSKKGNDTIVRVYVRWAGLIATAVHKPRYSFDDCEKGEMRSNNRLMCLARVQLQWILNGNDT